MFYASPLPRLFGRRRYVICVLKTRTGDTQLDTLYAHDAVPEGPDRRETHSWWVCQWYGFALGVRELWNLTFRPVWVLDEPLD